MKEETVEGKEESDRSVGEVGTAIKWGGRRLNWEGEEVEGVFI